MPKKKWHYAEISLFSEEERFPVPIVADGALAAVRVKARTLIPALLLDTTNRADIEHLTKTHRVLHTGEVTSSWGRTPTKDRGPIRLVLQFRNPVECNCILEFDALRQGGLVDQIIESEAVYIIAAKPGERLGHCLDREMVLVEVPSSEFRTEWDRILDKTLYADARNKGLTRGQARNFSRQLRQEWRRLGAMPKLGA